MIRRAKIIATIGPASSDPDVLSNMIKAGMNVARLNFSHGTHVQQKANYDSIRAISEKLSIPVAVMADFSGPKIRVGNMPEAGLPLVTDDFVYLRSTDSPRIGPASKLPVIDISVPGLEKALMKGNRILMDDGKLEVVVEEVDGYLIKTRVTNGGYLFSHKGVNLPGSLLQVKALTAKDQKDLEFALSLGVDAVALSFVNNAGDIEDAKDAIRRWKNDPLGFIPVIAKIERPEAVTNLDEILQAAEGIMVARGDLGIETSTEDVPIIQKSSIGKANSYAKYVITATQMLESMISNPRPTRAEASDVANAIFDGTDAVMLSGETAIGKFPVETIKVMAEIITKAEGYMDDWTSYPLVENKRLDKDEVSVCRAAKELAKDRGVVSTVVFSLTGRSALAMSKVRPTVPIRAFTPHRPTFNLLSMFWGVIPQTSDFADSLEEMIQKLDIFLLNEPGIEVGQQVVIICGLPIFIKRSPNVALLHTIGHQ